MTTAERTTTAIGSLPHHNVDAALEYSFRHGIPFLPQIPIRNSWEYMLPQALEGIPGLSTEPDGTASLNAELWDSRKGELDRRLAQAFAQPSTDKAAFATFEPSAAASSCWQPFVWELRERHTPMAKLQLTGPITCQWSLKLRDGRSLADFPGLTTQIYRLGLAKAISMIRQLKLHGIQPVFFLDEPALYGLLVTDPRHVIALQELKIMIQTLRKEGAIVGLHCCSNTDWRAILSLGLNYLSFDTDLSLEHLLTHAKPETEAFLDEGGRFALGVIPTGRLGTTHSADVSRIFAQLLERLAQTWSTQPERAKIVLRDSFFTPACGMALQSVSDAENALDVLTEFHDLVRSVLS